MRPALGMVGAASLIGVLVFTAAAWAVWRQSETYGTDLDFGES